MRVFKRNEKGEPIDLLVMVGLAGVLLFGIGLHAIFLWGPIDSLFGLGRLGSPLTSLRFIPLAIWIMLLHPLYNLICRWLCPLPQPSEPLKQPLRPSRSSTKKHIGGKK